MLEISPRSVQHHVIRLYHDVLSRRVVLSMYEHLKIISARSDIFLFNWSVWQLPSCNMRMTRCFIFLPSPYKHDGMLLITWFYPEIVLRDQSECQPFLYIDIRSARAKSQCWLRPDSAFGRQWSRCRELVCSSLRWLFASYRQSVPRPWEGRRFSIWDARSTLMDSLVVRALRQEFGDWLCNGSQRYWSARFEQNSKPGGLYGNCHH